MPNIEEKVQFAKFIETACSIASLRRKLKSLYNYDLPCTNDEWTAQTHLHDLLDADEIARYMVGGTHYSYDLDIKSKKRHRTKSNTLTIALVMLTLAIVIAVALLAWFLIGKMEFN